MVVYTLATWDVKPGQEEAFESAWIALGHVFLRLSRGPASEGMLLQRSDRPGSYVSFGAWPDADAVAAMRADADAQAAIQAVLDQCERGDPAMYDVVQTVSVGPPGRPARRRADE